MRTNTNAAVTNCNVFGLSQDRAVSLCNHSYACAAQHLASRHASMRARELDRAPLRRGLVTAVMAGAVSKAKRTCLAITGPQWQPVRLTSPELVTA